METLIGQIALFPYAFTPAGWYRCDGRLLPILQEFDLFALLGTQFGGDGKVTFALPRLPVVKTANGVKLHYCIAWTGGWPQQAATARATAAHTDAAYVEAAYVEAAYVETASVETARAPAAQPPTILEP